MISPTFTSCLMNVCKDGIERDPEQYFKRYNSKNPERGGAKKTIPVRVTRKEKPILKTYAKDGQIYATAI